MTQPRIFISHSDRDSYWFAKFVESLQQASLDFWYDRGGLHAGDEWIKTIEREIRARDIFLLVITPRSWASQWVQNELSLALIHHKQILGVIHQPTPDLGGFILIYQLFDAVGQMPEQVARLVAETLRTLPPEVDIVTTTSADADVPVAVPGGIADTPQHDAASEEMSDTRQGALVSGTADFIAGIEFAVAASRPQLRRLADWANELEQRGYANVSTYHGKTGSTLLPRLPHDGVGLVSIYNANGAYLQFWRSVFERRAPLALPRVEGIISPKTLGQGTWTSIISEELLAALADAYREAMANHG
jgi:TIR domain-containing protein